MENPPADVGRVDRQVIEEPDSRLLLRCELDIFKRNVPRIYEVRCIFRVSLAPQNVN